MQQTGPAIAQRTVLAALLAVDMLALIYSMWTQTHGDLTATADFLSYFTIESNFAACLLLTVTIGTNWRPPRWSSVTGAVTSYMVITGVVYQVFLTSNPVDLLGNVPNTVLHFVMPVGMLGYWIAFKGTRVAMTDVAIWMLYPIGYMAYTLVRGSATNWYPYYFLDPRAPGGYPQVATYVVLLLSLCGVLMVGVNLVGRLSRTR